MTEWKPEKNISSPWDANVWENNIGQPVLDTYSASVQNNTYIQPQGTLYIGTKWYDVDTTKLTSIKDVEAVFSAIGLRVSETNENFDKVKHLLIIPEKPKSLDEIQQEFDEKIDKLIEQTKRNFYAYKLTAERKYEDKFDRIFDNFEYVKENGFFPQIQTLTLDSSKFVAIGSSLEPSFVIKQGNKHEGYYTNGNQRYFRYYMPDKPSMIVRFFMKTCLGFVWVDEKDG
jgi:hypothetical protein